MAPMEPQPHSAANTLKPSPQITERDIVFYCPVCHGELVVDLEGAGMECLCAHCGASLVVPAYSSARQIPEPVTLPALAATLPADPPQETLPSAASATSTAATPVAPAEPTGETLPNRQFDFSDQAPEQLTRRLEELKHQLKENRSQDTEMRGHVNRATMELHRLQLRLKKLQDRQRDIESEIMAARDWLRSTSV